MNIIIFADESKLKEMAILNYYYYYTMCLYCIVTYARFVFVCYANNTNTSIRKTKTRFHSRFKNFGINIWNYIFYNLVIRFYPRDFSID